jgi:hypothetical protein
LIIKSPSGCASCAVANKGTLKDSFTWRMDESYKKNYATVSWQIM